MTAASPHRAAPGTPAHAPAPGLDEGRGAGACASGQPSNRPARTRSGGSQHLPPLAGALRRLVVGVPLVAASAALAVLVPAAALAPAVLGVLGPVVLVASVLVGLPHGAVDLVQPDVVAGLDRRGRAVAGAAYLGAAGLALAAWWFAPVTTVAALLALSVVHFGTADDVITRWRTGSDGSRTVRGLRVLALGGLPVLLPFALHERAVAPLVEQVAPGGGAVLHGGATIALVPVTAAAVATVVLATTRGDRVGALEPALLAALFLAVPPLVSFALYFGLWHSLRHVGRTLGADLAARHAGADGGTDVARALARFSRSAVLPTAVALGAGSVIALVAGAGAAAAALVLVLCLTVPHAAVVARQDSRVVLEIGPDHGRTVRHPADTALL